MFLEKVFSDIGIVLVIVEKNEGWMIDEQQSPALVKTHFLVIPNTCRQLFFGKSTCTLFIEINLEFFTECKMIVSERYQVVLQNHRF